ncbi:hypothetical protein BC830DRAFT_1147583 [Chytriomyces sp. MP71]|nr:hypothetical protein BC830DRAFT_1147583 [Chytriomyces sp. MP71]
MRCLIRCGQFCICNFQKTLQAGQDLVEWCLWYQGNSQERVRASLVNYSYLASVTCFQHKNNFPSCGKRGGEWMLCNAGWCAS